ncbi:MAG: hypothetical protein PHU42_02505 [Patescibacteria group bacterium]|nr:hypothetical protein [Patescibacteria group bacterium]
MADNMILCYAIIIAMFPAYIYLVLQIAVAIKGDSNRWVFAYIGISLPISMLLPIPAEKAFLDIKMLHAVLMFIGVNCLLLLLKVHDLKKFRGIILK